jgi:hypothetical protein
VCCFTDWFKALERVNWTEWTEILKGAGINRRERRWITELYMFQGIKLKLGQGRPIGRAASQGCCLPPSLFKLKLDQGRPIGTAASQGCCLSPSLFKLKLDQGRPIGTASSQGCCLSPSLFRLKLDQGRPIGTAASQGCCLLPSLFSQYLTDEDLEVSWRLPNRGTSNLHRGTGR